MSEVYSFALEAIRTQLYYGVEFDAGIKALIELYAQSAPLVGSAELRKLPFHKDVLGLYRWITHYLLDPVIPDSAQVFWIGLLNPFIDEDEIYIVASRFYDPYSTHCLWAFEEDNDYFTDTSYFHSPVLRGVAEHTREHLKLGMSLIGLGYVCLAVRDIFHEANPKAVLRGMISKAIVVGLDPLTYGGYAFCRLGYVYPHGLFVDAR
jgi:hypothetical protein